MNLERGEQTYRGLISTMRCSSKLLILKLFIIQIPYTQIIWCLQKLLPPIYFDKLTVKDHRVSLTF